MKNGSDALDVSIGIAEDRVNKLVEEGIQYNKAIDTVLNEGKPYTIHKSFHSTIRKRLLQKQINSKVSNQK